MAGYRRGGVGGGDGEVVVVEVGVEADVALEQKD